MTVRINALPVADPLDGTEHTIVEQGGVTKRSHSGAYAPPGDYVESADVTDIVVVDFGMLPGTPDANTLYFEREEA